MKEIRKYIDENRDRFDDKEPPAGHAERFEALLKDRQKPAEKKPVRRKKLISIFSAAAAIAVLCLIAIKVYIPDNVDLTPGTEGTEILTDKFQSTNEYYNELMKQEISDIMCKLAQTDEDNQEQLTSDLEQMIEYNAEFVNEMAANENKEVALQYLIKHYEVNIKALEDINNKLGRYTNC